MPILIGVSILAASATAEAPDPAASVPPRAHDCGVEALFLLLRFEGRPVDLATLDRAMPAGSPQGFSMAELAEAARALGLGLEGIDLRGADLPRDRPVIAFTESDGEGHFVVLRPVGVTGRMVQLLNPPAPPQVVDFETLRDDPAWTGRLLVPKSRLERLAPTLTIAAAAAGLALLAVPFYRRGMKPPRIR